MAAQPNVAAPKVDQKEPVYINPAIDEPNQKPSRIQRSRARRTTGRYLATTPLKIPVRPGKRGPTGEWIDSPVIRRVEEGQPIGVLPADATAPGEVMHGRKSIPALPEEEIVRLLARKSITEQFEEFDE